MEARERIKTYTSAQSLSVEDGGGTGRPWGKKLSFTHGLVDDSWAGLFKKDYQQS